MAEFFKIDEKLYKRWYPWNDRYSSHDTVTQNPSFTKSAFERIPKATWRWHCREWNSAQEGWVQAQTLPPPSYATWRKLPHFSFLNWQDQQATQAFFTFSLWEWVIQCTWTNQVNAKCFFLLWLHYEASGISVLRSGDEPAPWAEKFWSSSHWTTRESLVPSALSKIWLEQQHKRDQGHWQGQVGLTICPTAK